MLMKQKFKSDRQLFEWLIEFVDSVKHQGSALAKLRRKFYRLQAGDRSFTAAAGRISQERCRRQRLAVKNKSQPGKIKTMLPQNQVQLTPRQQTGELFFRTFYMSKGLTPN